MAAPDLLTAGTEDHDLTKLDDYRAVGGYESLAKARADAPQAVIDTFGTTAPQTAEGALALTRARICGTDSSFAS